jgi:hypothetical protein
MYTNDRLRAAISELANLLTNQQREKTAVSREELEKRLDDFAKAVVDVALEATSEQIKLG